MAVESSMKYFNDRSYMLDLHKKCKDLTGKEVKLTQERIALFTILISVVCFAFAWMMARSLTKRILHLKKKMKQAQQGNFNQGGSNPYTDEIG